MNKHLKRVIYVVALLSGLLSLIWEMNTVISILLGMASGIYLFLGWMLLNPEHNRRFDFLYFFVGYFFSMAFIALLFKNRSYPMDDIFLYVSASMLLLSLILVVLLDKARGKQVGVNVVEIGVLLGVVVAGIIMG